jgi:hypothetical protein
MAMCIQWSVGWVFVASIIPEPLTLLIKKSPYHTLDERVSMVMVRAPLEALSG